MHTTDTCPSSRRQQLPFRAPVPLFPLRSLTPSHSHSPRAGFEPHLLRDVSPDHLHQYDPYHQRISKAPKAAVTYHHCLGFLLVHSFHETSCAPTGGYLWRIRCGKTTCREMQGQRFSLFCSIKLDYVTEGKMAPPVTTTNGSK